MAQRSRLTTSILACALAMALAGCITRGVDSLPPMRSEVDRRIFDAQTNDKVDILFVIDDSGSMAEEQENLGRNFKNFVDQLASAPDKPFNYRIGVVSTDIGIGGGVDLGGDCALGRPESAALAAGVLQTRPRTDAAHWEDSSNGILACEPDSPFYSAELCDTLKRNRQWLIDNCKDMPDVLGGEAWLSNSRDNPLPAEEVARRFRCMGALGVSGCYVEQPLEAAKRVLQARPDFLRKDAHLAVIFITDEIDCSLADPKRLDDPFVDPSLQCYRAAQRCSGETQDVVSVGGEQAQISAYSSCEDDPSWLIPVDTYRQFFSNVKGAGAVGRVILAGITGNPDYSMSPFRDDLGQDPSSVVFAWSETATSAGYLPSCSSPAGSAAPNRRVQDLLSAFPNPRTGQPSWVSICSDNFGPALEEIGTRIRTEPETVCVDIPASAVEAGADPNMLCVLDELSENQELLRPGITADQGWELVPNETACPPGGLTRPGLTRVEVRIAPALRATFGATSKLAVTCTQ